MKRRLLILAAAAGLSGCAALNSVHSDIRTYGEWPNGRAPGTFAFDRLPSQQSNPQATDRLEQAARPALQKAGFVEAGPGQAPDVTVQVAARITRTDIDLWTDPLWWRGGFGIHRRPWVGTGWSLGLRADFPRYDREVAVLIRDGATSKPLYEARASHEGTTSGGDGLTQALFEAALIDFPRTGINPRTVVVTLP